MNTGQATAGRTTLQVQGAGRRLLQLLGRLHSGRLEMHLPGGQRLRFEGERPGCEAELHVHDWRMAADVLRAGDIGLAQAYLDGRWTTPDLTAVLQLAAENRQALRRALHGSRIGKLAYLVRHWLRRNTRTGARRNIHAHYDLGNEFYRSWLDDSMTYSSALFAAGKSLSLEQAQAAKYDRILGRLDVRAGDEILEIGCGWGGFAERAALTRRARVHGITISEAQLAHARRRLAGLADLASVELRDYRDVRGRYRFIVSIEMLEAVGEAYWPSYFGALRGCLQAGGKALIQTIVIDEALFEHYRRGTDFIQQYIFPGGMLPSPSAFRACARRAGFRVESEFAFGADYAETLRRWRRRYNAAAPGLRALGFDERFERLWNFYLSYCEAGFRAGSIDVVQWELSRD